MTSFDPIAKEYEAGRPDYPDAVFDALEPLDGELVLEGGAGSGIATRALLKRGARVIPFDVGEQILKRAVSRSAGLAAVVADGAALPFRDMCADTICFAQSWHWLDERSGCQEAARVPRPGGRWAGWWSHVRVVTVDEWILDERSKSYNAALPEADRTTLLRTIEGAILEAFRDRRMHVPYETWMWIATTRSM